MCIRSETRRRYQHTDRHKALRLVTGRQSTPELVHDLQTKLPNRPGRATAYRIIKQFSEAPEPYIQENGGVWDLTDLGKHHTRTGLDYLLVLPPVRGAKSLEVAA